MAVVSLPTDKKRSLAKIAIPIALLAALLLYIGRDVYIIQNTLFHTDENSPSSISSNEAHWQASYAAWQDVIRHPLGQGPGTAGPASFYSDNVKIAENYYLQIGQEVGVVGMGLFILIQVWVMQDLWRQRGRFWPLILFCSAAGITVVNMFLHGWADETVSMLWWGTAGVYLGAETPKVTKQQFEQLQLAT